MGDIIDLEVASAKRTAKTRQDIVMGKKPVGPDFCIFDPLPQKFADRFLHAAVPGRKNGVDGYMMLKFKIDDPDAARAVDARFIKAAYLDMYYGAPQGGTSRNLSGTFNDAAFKPATPEPGQTIAFVPHTIDMVCMIKKKGPCPIPTDDPEEYFGRDQLIVFYDGMMTLDVIGKHNGPDRLRYLGKDGTLTRLPADDFDYKPY